MTVGNVILENAASLMLDFDDGDWQLISFDGTWRRGRGMTRSPLLAGVTVSDSKLGCPFNEHNSLVYLVCPESGPEYCEVVGIIRRESRPARFSKNAPDCRDIPLGFSWASEPGESFTTPEAVFSYFSSGWNDAALDFHFFIRKHIVRARWRDRIRPVLINNREVTYFNFTEEKLLALASRAKKLGVELFVLDDVGSGLGGSQMKIIVRLWGYLGS